MKRIIELFPYFRPYWKNASLNILFTIFSVLFSISTFVVIAPFLGILFGTQPMVGKPNGLVITNITQYVNYFFSELIKTHGKLETLTIVSFSIIFCSFLRNLFAYLSLYFLAPMRAKIVRDIRNHLYDKILLLPLSYFSNEKKGDLMSRMTNDVQEIEVSILSSLEMILRDPITVLMYLSYLVFLNPRLTLFVFILLPVGGLIIGRIGRNLRKTSFKSQTRLGTLLALIEETLSGLRIVKAFTAEKPITKRFQSINEEFTRLTVKINRRRSLASPISEFLGTIVVIIVMFYGATLILGQKTHMRAHELIIYIGIFYMIIEPVKRFTSAYYNILKGLASAERIDFIMKAENKIKEKKDAIEINTFENCIEYCNVSFKYDQHIVLQDINLKIEKGKTVALVGQSGAGKSTLVDLLPRFYDIEHGEILIDGINIKDFKIKDLRRLMGIVNQEPILFNDTFYNNIVFGRESSCTPEEVEFAAKVAHAHEFITLTKHKYEHSIGDRGGKLSGGQKQRLSIARAVLNNPPILILDEATSSLDTESERLVQDALNVLMQNRTTIVIAHRLSTVIHADEICVIHDGKIVERGRHNELIVLNGYYKRLHDLQMFSD
jgi:ATP-binding cassette, subfamily B, bacterial MsbA